MASRGGGGGGLEEKLLIEGGDGHSHSHSHSQRKLRSSLSHIRASRRATLRRQHPSHPPQYKEEEEEEDGGQVEDNRAPWRKYLGDALESTLAHLTILSLLLIDLLATAIDILKALHNSSTDLSSCLALLHSCPCPPSPPFERAREWSFLFWISIVILGVLAFNVLALLIAFGAAFFHDPGYVLDLVVVFTALSLEIFLDSETASLLVILNLWRIVRVAHGIFEVTDDALEEEIRALKSRAEAATSARSEDARLLHEKDERIAELESRLRMHIEKSPSFSTYIHS